ncbi:MAG TPA: RNA methyltransferase [Terracidiphilus sp.]|jgi:TrmH family RNA methyltransferase
MPVRIVQSKHNARLKQLRQALASPGRSKGDAAGIEGPNLVLEAVRAGLRIECVFVAQEAEDLLAAMALPAGTEVLLTPKAVLDSALATEAPQPVAALVEPRQWSWGDVFASRQNRSALIVVLAGVQDPGNLGTILRSAEAFGATGVVSLPGTVSAWNPKAVRASAGSVLRVPVVATPVEECFLRLRESEAAVWTTAARAATEIHCADLTTPLAVVIGNEGNGVPREIAARADGALTIPCPGPVESLNAAVAASVVLYEAARQRATAADLRPAAGRAR